MIESAGGLIPFICHILLILFGGFMSLNLIFNPNFVKTMGMETDEARFVARGMGFSILAITLVIFATLFQIWGFESTFEVFTVLFLFTLFGFTNQALMFLKIVTPLHDDKPIPISNMVRPLIPMVLIIIRALTL